jgi:hypothetical protein
MNTVTHDGKIGSAAKNTAMLDQQLRALRSAAAAGLPVTMVELGNELYQSGHIDSGPHGHDYAKRFPTAADYATQINAWIAAIHGAFPGAKIATVAADANDVRGLGKRRRTWNATVLPLLKGEKAVTLHENLRVFDASESAADVLAFPYLHFQKLRARELRRLAGVRQARAENHSARAQRRGDHAVGDPGSAASRVVGAAAVLLPQPAARHHRCSRAARRGAHDQVRARSRAGEPVLPAGHAGSLADLRRPVHGDPGHRPVGPDEGDRPGSTGVSTSAGSGSLRVKRRALAEISG